MYIRNYANVNIKMKTIIGKLEPEVEAYYIICTRKFKNRM